MRSAGGTNSGLAASVVACDEFDDRVLGRAVVPRGQRIAFSLRPPGEAERSRAAEHEAR